MTYLDIVTKATVEVFGSDEPQDEITTALYGSEGIIGKIHREIQEEYDYWFMLAQTTETLIDATAAYDIDYEFKKEIDLRILDEEGYYAAPLTKITPENADTLQVSETEPEYYWIDYSGGYRRFNLYPTPNVDAGTTRTLYVRYWKYLDRLSDTQATFEATEDVLSIEAPYLIIYRAASMMCTTIENYEKLSLMEQRASAQLDRLQRKDWQYRFANIQLPYRRI